MAKNDNLHNMAKQLYSMRAKKSQAPKKVAAKSAPKMEPKAKAAAAPKTKPAPAKTQSKNVSIKKPVAKASPEAKAGGSGKKPPKAPSMKGSKPQMAPRAKEIAAEMAADAEFSQLSRDLPKGGGRALQVAEELAPTATSKAEMAAVKSGSGKAAGRMGKLIGGSMVGATLAGPVGFGLQALMEGLAAEEAGDPSEAHISNRELMAGRDAADKAINKQANQARASGRLKPPSRHEEFYGSSGPSEQQRMEDEFAEVLKKQPR